MKICYQAGGLSGFSPQSGSYSSSHSEDEKLRLMTNVSDGLVNFIFHESANFWGVRLREIEMKI